MSKLYGSAITLDLTIDFTKNAPIDARVAVQSISDLSNIKEYEGIIVYVKEKKAHYTFKNNKWYLLIDTDAFLELLNNQINHVFLTKTLYDLLKSKDDNTIYGIYEDNFKSVTIPSDIIIADSKLPYLPSGTDNYVIIGNPITKVGVYEFEAKLINTDTTIWEDGSIKNKKFKVTVLSTTKTWVFGNVFPIIFS